MRPKYQSSESKQQLQAELQLTRIIRRAENLSEGRAAQIAGWRGEYRRVECVERFGAKLQRFGFFQPELPEYREIEVACPIRAQRVPSKVPECVLCGRSERRSIDPRARVWIGQHSIPDQIG